MNFHYSPGTSHCSLSFTGSGVWVRYVRHAVTKSVQLLVFAFSHIDSTLKGFEWWVCIFATQPLLKPSSGVFQNKALPALSV